MFERVDTMPDMRIILFSFPILFMFHDFEEIIFMKPWVIKNNQNLRKRFPRLAKKYLNHFNSLSTSSFAMGVAEEFILISIITILSFVFNWYYLWLGTYIAFTVHLIVHCIQCIAYKSYVPCIATSIICLPICLYLIVVFIKNNNLNYAYMVSFSLVCIVLLVLNLRLIHKLMSIFDRWLTRYQTEIK